MIYYQTLLFKARLHRLEGDSRGSCFSEELTDPLHSPRDPVERALPWLTQGELSFFLQQWTRTPEEQNLELQWATERFMEFYRAEPHTDARQEIELDTGAEHAGGGRAIVIEPGSFLMG